jgi:hypothetical protein
MSALNKLSSLNGWQRLFVAFIVFAYLPLSIAIISAKSEVPAPSKDLLISILEKNKAPKLLNAELKIEWAKDDWETVPPKGRKSFRLNYGYGWKFDISMLDSVPAKEASNFVDSVDNLLGSYYSKELWIVRATVASFLVGLAFFIYAFGWTLGWIYRGFRKNKE